MAIENMHSGGMKPAEVEIKKETKAEIEIEKREQPIEQLMETVENKESIEELSARNFIEVEHSSEKISDLIDGLEDCGDPGKLLSQPNENEENHRTRKNDKISD